VEERIIGYLKETDASIEELARYVGKSIRHTRRALVNLRRKGLVEVYQKGRKWLWRLI